MIALACLIVGFLAGKLQGTLDERNRVARMIRDMTRRGAE